MAWAQEEDPEPADAPDEVIDEAAPDTDADTSALEEAINTGAGEEIIVYDDLEIARRRAKVDQDLRNLGYRAGTKRDDRTIYRPEVPWKPSVVVYDEGFVIIKRSPVRFAPPTRKQRPIDYLWCVPPLTPMCVRIGGQIVSDAKLQPQKYRVAQGIDPDFRDWRAAIVSNAWAERIGEEIPDQLDACWRDGQPFEGDAVLATPADRRREILAFRSSRACTPEGMEVRDLVDLFLEYEVQASDTPLSPEEIQTATSEDLCGTPLGFSANGP